MSNAKPYTLDLSNVIRLSDEVLMKICEANPDLEIEQNAAGQLEIVAPAGLKSTHLETKFVVALGKWNDDHGRGLVFGGTAGFRLPNGAMRAPDAAWVRRQKWEALAPEQQETFSPIVPDFLVEVRSPSNSRSALEEKMKEWIDNGCRLGWLIDSSEQRASIYRADGSVEEKTIDDELTGENVLPGFTFDLRRLE